MSDTSRIFPKKIEGANPPSRVYDGAKRDMGLSYEELNVIINLNNPPLRFGQMRPLVDEIYNFSDGYVRNFHFSELVEIFIYIP